MKVEKKIDIDYACSQDFDSMQEISHGVSHCSSCKKNVTNFASNKDDEIENQDCGLFHLSQVNSIKSTKSISFLAPISLIALLNLTVSPLHGQTQTLDSIPRITHHDKNQPTENTIAISGTVKEGVKKTVLPFIEVVIASNGKTIMNTLTDAFGEFTFHIDSSKYDLSQLYIHFNKEGYQDHIVGPQQLEKEPVIELIASIDLSKAGVSTAHYSIRSLGRIKGDFIFVDGKRVHTSEYREAMHNNLKNDAVGNKYLHNGEVISESEYKTIRKEIEARQKH